MEHLQSTTPLPQPTTAEWHLKRKYYTMRDKPIQGIVGYLTLKTGKEGHGMSIIEELYLGNIRPSSSMYPPDSPVAKAIKQKGIYLDELMESMDDDAKKLFEKYSDAQADIDEAVQYDMFVYALKFGVLLMTEIFMGMDYILKEVWGEHYEINPS